LEKERIRATLELEAKVQTGTLDEIRYHKGKKDGLNRFFQVVDGMMASEGKKPLAAGLMSRILSFGDTNGH
jgi:hypothetical protein